MGSGRYSVGYHLTESVTHRYIDAGDDLRLHVAISGKGPPLVLLHGFTGSTETWKSLRACLDDAFTIIAVDLAGHGRSSSPSLPARYSSHRFTDDLEAICRELGIDKIALMGYSMGGRLALRFALAHPLRLSSLILESTSPGIPEGEAREARLESDARLAQAIEENGIEQFVNYWESLSLWESQRDMPGDLKAELRSQRLAGNPRGLANSLRGAGAATMSFLNDDDLKSIAVSTLLIAGALDAPYVQHAQAMQRAVPGARLTIVEASGHAVHFEKPKQLATAVRHFLLNSHRE
jgi:2-succinyl-6-hydroxy-2,4-cyclohexadiene-1-carboxylate synthase